MRSRSLPLARVALVALSLCSSLRARADVDLKMSGWISSDIRYRLAGEPRYDVSTPTQWQLLPNGFSRNENRIRAALDLAIGKKVKARADAELLLYGFSDLKDLDSTTLRDRVDPYYLEVHAAYLDVTDILPHLDLRIGRQVVPWGAADKFNPVSNLNTLDLSDPLLFGRALANNMVRLDYNPVGDLIFTAVVVPVFRPAQLPRTAPIALLDPLRPAPVSEQGVRAAIDQDRLLTLNQSIEAQVLEPEISLNNVQVGLRAAAKLGGQDVALSYYHGRFGVPAPAWSIATGSVTDVKILTEVMYPRMDVLGLELAGSIEKLAGLGYWAEAAVNFPQEVTFAIYESLQFNELRARAYLPPGAAAPAGCPQVVNRTPNYQGVSCPIGTRVARPTLIESTPFVKSTVGVDYTLWKGHVYLNFQWVHGFIDEFGAGRAARPRVQRDDRTEEPRVEARLGDYLVAGADLKFAGDRLLLRLFTAFKLPSYSLPSANSAGAWDDYAFTAVLFPQLIWTVWDGTELMLGSFVMLGDRSTKFGDPAAGATEIFAKARVSF